MGKNYKGITFKIVFQKKKRVYKENEASNASNSTKSDKNKKYQNRNSEVKSVLIIDDRMIEHLNGWDMSKKVY